MSLDLPLIQDDRNFLTESKENTQDQNSSIANSSATLTTEIAKLLLLDVPFKKKLDPVHVDIFEYEEELRRLNGTSIIQPLQEKGFTISDSSGVPARLFINNERLILLRKTTTSTSSLSIAVTTQTLNISTGLTLTKSQAILIAYDYSNKMQGTVVSYDSLTGLLVAGISYIVGSGTFSAWDVYTEIVNVPLFPVRGYSKSQPAGTNFDIWSRDRFGSTTSSKLSASLITIDDTQKKLAVLFDGTLKVEIDFSTILSIEQIGETIFGQTSGTETTATLNNPLVLANTDTISMTKDIVDEVVFVTGATAQLSNTMIAAGTDIVSKVSNITEPVVLVRDVDYSISNSTGIITFLKPIMETTSVSTSLDISTGVKNLTIAKLLNISTGQTITFVSDSNNLMQGTVEFYDPSSGFLSAAITLIKGSGTHLTWNIFYGYQILATYTSSFQLVRGTNYSIVNLTGVITFLTSVLPDYQMLIDYKYQIKLPLASVASTIQALLQQSDPLLEQSSCVFNPATSTITIASSHGGPTSTVEVVPATDSDLMSILGFDDQYLIQGKFQNNLFNVEIDGQAAEIKINDFRLCFEDVERGYNNDDMGFYWTGSLSNPLGMYGRNRVGPLFCSGINNGKDVAKSIEAQLRMVGTGGFKDSSVNYFTSSNSFVIYSGTIGVNSSVHVLAASDSDRDARSLLGFNPPQEERGNEEYFETLQKLYDKLTTKPYVSVSVPQVPDRLSHSILYQRLDGVNIDFDFQDYDITTTKIYDDGSRGLPRLYPNGKLIVDATNDKINFFELINVEKTAYIEQTVYENESFLAEAIQTALNTASGGPVYTCIYKSQIKKFIITSDLAGGKIFSLLWQTGKYAINNIGNYIGFNVSSDKSGLASYSSDREIIFYSQDYFYPFFPNQFDGTPKVSDFTVDEQSALLKEEEYLNDESLINNYINRMLSLSQYDNESLINSWEQLATLEFEKVNQEFIALRYQKGAYANHLNETDSEITTKTIACENISLNRDNLIQNLSYHAKFLNILQHTKTFIQGIDFTNKGAETLTISVLPGSHNRRIYPKPAPIVKYTSETKHIPGRFNPIDLLTTSTIFTSEGTPAFNLKSTKTGTEGYCYTPSDFDGYNIKHPADSFASVLSSNMGPYDMSVGDTLKMKIDVGIEQTATFDATPGYTESRVATTSMFVIKTNVNDTIDFTEGNSEITITIPQNVYTGTNLASIIQSLLNSAGTSNYTVDYNSTNANKFTIISDGSGGTGIFELLWLSGSHTSNSICFTLGFNVIDDVGTLAYVSDNNVAFSVITGVNDKFVIKIDGVLSSDLIISQGNYLYGSLISEMSTQIANDPNFDSFSCTVSYPANKFRITSGTKGTGSTIDVYEGVDDFLRTVSLDGDVPVHGGGNIANIDAVTVEEVCAVLISDISGISAYPDNNKVAISTLSTKGSLSTIEITGGTCRTIIGFDLIVNYGYNQDNKLKVDIDSDQTKDPIELIADTSPISGSLVANSIKTLLRAIASGGYTLANCTFDETTAFQYFDHSLRIISGTTGTSSSVVITDKTMKIVTGVNDKIDFDEIIGFELTATLTAGFYNPTTLASEIKTQLDSVGSNVYTVVYSSKKITISTSGATFRILFGTGTNALQSVADLIGFYSTDHIGNISYSSDGLVKSRSCMEELGFNLQTIEPGHSIDSVKASVNGTIMKCDIYWSDHTPGSKTDLKIDITTPASTVLDLMTYINSFSGYQTQQNYAYLLGRVPAKFKINNNDDFIVNVNNTVDQTITFSASKATSISGLNCCTRIFSGSDRLRLRINDLATETSVVNEVLFSGGPLVTPPSIFTTTNSLIKVASSTITFTRTTLTPPFSEVVTLNEVTDYTLNYSTGAIILRSNLQLGDRDIRIDYTYYSGLYEIVLGTQMTSEAIAAKIQQEVRNIVHTDIEIQTTFSEFTCVYDSGRYVLSTGNGGSGSKLHIYDGSINSAAPFLKLGVSYGGIETEGIGDVVNSSFVTANEIVTKLSTLTGMTVSGSDYIKLQSTVLGDTTRVHVKQCLLASKLGFDIGINNDAYPLLDTTGLYSSSIKDFSNQEIKNPASYDVTLGWQTSKGNIEVLFYSIDDQYLEERLPLIGNRLTFISTRKTQIGPRVSDIQTALTTALYESRKDKVRTRLNKKYGSYVKVGDKLSQKEGNENAIATNDAYISGIDDIL